MCSRESFMYLIESHLGMKDINNFMTEHCMYVYQICRTA